MRYWLLPVLLCGALDAAVIRGLVVEHQTGRPLARTLVVAQPVAGTAGGPQAVRTNTYGIFEFPPVAAGAYLVTATRTGFAPAQYGQKSWRSSGLPVVLEETGVTALSMRMQRYGAVTGTVVDENDVGLPEHDVIVYRDTRPPRMAGRARSDDRGMFRVGSLEPGSYLVRTAGKQYDEGSYLPTFARESSRVEEARPVEVTLDQESDTTVRPFPGRLLMVSGRVLSYPQAQVAVTLVSDMGTEAATTDQRGAFEFKPMPPGAYELLAIGPPDRRGSTAAFLPLLLDRDQTDLRVSLSPYPELQISVEDTKGAPMNPATVQVQARRKDLAGEGKTETLRLQQGRVSLQPGYWELTLAPMANYFAAAFSAPGTEVFDRGPADGWNQVLLAAPGVQVKFVLSAKPATIRGKVTGAGQEEVGGVPVFLEPWDSERRRRVAAVRVTRTDRSGQFSFIGLPPGSYRLLSTFEYQSVDSATLDASGARQVKIGEGEPLTQDLALFVLR